MNPDAEYRLRVLDPQGTERHILELDPPLTSGTPLYLAGGVRRMEVRPIGDCREATFEGDPASLGIGPRDTVQVQYRPNASTAWRNRYAGTVVVSGSSRSEIGRYKLQGFRYRRLTEVECRTLLTEADLGAQVRQLFTDLIASGQLGTTLQTPDLTGIPNRNVTSAALAPNWWHAARLLDERLKGRDKQTTTYLQADGSTVNQEVNPDWGVNADLRPVFGYPDGVLEIDERMTGVEIDGMDLDSTVLVTDVRVLFARTMNAQSGESLVYPGSDLRKGTTYRDDLKAGRPIAHEIPVAPRTWGVGWRTLPLGADAALFAPLTPGGLRVGVAVALYTGPGARDPIMTGEASALWDNRSDTTVSIQAPPSASAITYSLTLTYPDDTPLPDGVLVAAQNAGVELVSLSARNDAGGVITQLMVPTSPVAPLYLLPGATRDERLAPSWGRSKEVTFWLRHVDLSAPVVISAACLARADQGLLHASADPLARTPTLNPVTARIPSWDVEPAATARLTLRDVAGKVVEIRELPIDLLVYDVDEDGQLYTEVRCGQSDDAEALSFGGVLGQGTQASTLSAVEAST
ncbi:hypothetical protein [Deinococcus gobiensis]|uniref:Uncharacterized protein n=1 Tax=Deinococcus gobiensis (strain DSM 21396 / JCM 16679 / CGMCC 1.7299 / I-0) TaxID=745776 RepID=H8H2I1_DEIGI|nr:hypothetical protein [Deinococcus gobiensis]AFD27728.1 hypothetical protein DGo_PB0459 [Deinococcus gobiensis I-0]